MVWRLWAKALGEKAHKKDQVADKVALIRTIIFGTYLITSTELAVCFGFSALMFVWIELEKLAVRWWLWQRQS